MATESKLRSSIGQGLAGAVAIASSTAAYGAIQALVLPANIGPVVAPGTGGPVTWDANGDAVNDFSFNYRFPNSTGTTGVVWQANMNPISSTGAAVVGYLGPFINYATNLAPGAPIGPVLNPGASFRGQAQVTLGSVYRSGGVPSPYGGFSTGSPNVGGAGNPSSGSGLVGFRFGSGVNTRFGWLRVNVIPDGGGIQFVEGAFENDGRSIAAGAIPEPASLSALAFGALALGRRKR